MIDVLVKGGTLIDGTGSPPVTADVGIVNGKVVEIGSIKQRAQMTVDADGLLVCPGFIDVHTHYDPHVMWDPLITPSSRNGVTTVLGGNCGFSLAPMDRSAADYIIPMLARVEGMPTEALELALDLRWSSFSSWLGRLDGRLGINAGFMVGHSTVRRLVMGEAAVGNLADGEQIERMALLVRHAIGEGAWGFSSTSSEAHNDHNNDPVPSRWAHRQELFALSAAARKSAATMLEYLPSGQPRFVEDDYERMTQMSLAAELPLNWNLLSVREGAEAAEERTTRLGASDHAASHGARVVGLTMPKPVTVRLTLEAGLMYEILPEWSSVLSLPLDARMEALANEGTRERLRIGHAAAPYRFWSDFERTVIADVRDAANQHYVGRTVRELAAERQSTPLDTFFDVALADRLATGFVSSLGDSE